jgi:hypothetical protein
MSILVFRTRPDSEEAVSVAGAGYLGAGGKGAVSVADSALTMSELQERDEHGALVLGEDGNPKPLEGAALKTAAEAFAEDRGLVVAEMEEEQFAQRGEELGQPADRPPARDVALEAGARDRGMMASEAAKTRVTLAAEAAAGLASPAPEVPAEEPVAAEESPASGGARGRSRGGGEDA